MFECKTFMTQFPRKKMTIPTLLQYTHKDVIPYRWFSKVSLQISLEKYRYFKEKLLSDYWMCQLTTKVGRSPSLERRVVVPGTDTRVQCEWVAHGVLPFRVIRLVHVWHAHPKKRFVISQLMTRLECWILDDTAVALNSDNLCGCSFGHRYNKTVIARGFLPEAVGKPVDFILCGAQINISLNVGEVIGAISVVKTAQTDQPMVFREFVAYRDFDDNILLTVPQNVDVVLTFHQNVASTLKENRQRGSWRASVTFTGWRGDEHLSPEERHCPHPHWLSLTKK